MLLRTAWTRPVTPVELAVESTAPRCSRSTSGVRRPVRSSRLLLAGAARARAPTTCVLALLHSTVSAVAAAVVMRACVVGSGVNNAVLTGVGSSAYDAAVANDAIAVVADGDVDGDAGQSLLLLLDDAAASETLCLPCRCWRECVLLECLVVVVVRAMTSDVCSSLPIRLCALTHTHKTSDSRQYTATRRDKHMHTHIAHQSNQCHTQTHRVTDVRELEVRACSS